MAGREDNGVDLHDYPNQLPEFIAETNRYLDHGNIRDSGNAVSRQPDVLLFALVSSSRAQFGREGSQGLARPPRRPSPIAPGIGRGRRVRSACTWS